MPTADEIREEQRLRWDKSSKAWTTWDELVMPMLAPVGEEMIRSLQLRDDTQHLDIASGTGEPGLTVAARSPRGRVVLTDLSSEMLATARAKAHARGLDNVEVHERGVDDLPFGDASFDTITCRFGVMFFPDIPAAVRNLVRMLRSVGRISVAVWAEPSGNPWATIPLEAIAAEVELPPVDANAPGMFRCAVPGSIAEIFRDAGLRDVVETDVRATVDPASADEYWNYMSEVAGPVIAGLALVDDAARERIRRAVLERVRVFELDGRPSIPLHARCIVGTK
jgi:SAM-dependent methyltransferase